MALTQQTALARLAPALFAAVRPASFGASTLLRNFATASAGGVVDVKDDSQFSALLKEAADKNQVAIVDFTAKWCGPCKFIAPHFEALSKEHANVKFLKVDIDSQSLSGTVQDHTVSAVPTFVLYKGSKRVETFTGARLDYLKELLAKHAK